MAALKYIPKLTKAFIDAIPQPRMTKQQLLKHFEKNQISQNEIQNSLPNLENAPDNVSISREELAAELRPHTYTTSTRTGEGNFYVDDEPRFEMLDSISPNEDGTIDFGTFELAARDQETGQVLELSRARVFMTADTPEKRRELVDEIHGRMGAVTTDPDSGPMKEFIQTGKLDRNSRTDIFVETVLDAVEGDSPLPYTKLVDPIDTGWDFSYAEFRRDALDQLNHGFPSQTTYGEYTTPGPKTDYTETLTQYQQNPHPYAPQYQDAENPLYSEPHFSDADDVVFHTRSSTRTPRPTPTNPNPNPILYGEETQSEWAKEHKRQLERYLDRKERADKLRTSQEDSFRVLQEERKNIEPTLTYEGSSFTDASGKVDHFYTDNRGTNFHLYGLPESPDPDHVWDTYVMKKAFEDETYTRPNFQLDNYTYDTPMWKNEYTGELIDAPTGNFLEDVKPQFLEPETQKPHIPPSPLQKNWEDYALRSLIAEAIDKDLPGVALATGKQNADRYRSFMSAEDAKGLENFYDNKMRNKLSKLAKKYKTALQTVDIPLSDETKFLYDPSTTHVEDTLFGPRVVTPRGALESLPNVPEIDVLNAIRRNPNATWKAPEDKANLDQLLMDLANRDKNMVDRFYETHTEKAPYLGITPKMREAIKKGLPLSVLYGIGQE